MRKIRDGLYILSMAGLFVLSGWSFLFEGAESTQFEDMVLMISVAALSIVTFCAVLMDKKINDKGDEN